MMFIHIQTQNDDSVTPQFKRPLSDGAAVRSSGGELTSSHLSAFSVEAPVETGNTWWN